MVQMEKKNEKMNRAPRPPKSGSNLIIWVLILFGIVYLFRSGSQTAERPTQELSYSKFFDALKENPTTMRIKSCAKTDNIVRGEFSDGAKFMVNIPENDQDLIRIMRENVRDFDIRPPKTLWMNLFYSLGPMILFILFLWLFVYRGGGAGGAGGGGGGWAFGEGGGAPARA